MPTPQEPQRAKNTQPPQDPRGRDVAAFQEAPLENTPPPAPREQARDVQPSAVAALAPGGDVEALRERAAAVQPPPEVVTTILRSDRTAIDQLEAMRQEEARRKQTAIDQDVVRYQHFIKCRRGHIGVFCHESPVGRQLTEKDWYSTYRAPGESWREEVVCQVCYNADPVTLEMRGEFVPLQLTYVGVTLVRGRRSPVFIVPNRWCYRYPRSPEQRALELPSRSARVEWASGNSDWRPTPEQLSREAEARQSMLQLVGAAR